MRWALPWALGLLVVDVAASTACALFPLRSQLSNLQNIAFWRRTYSPGDSNLDVWALSVGRGLLLVLFLLVCLGRDNSYSLTARTRQYQRLLTVNSLIALATEVLPPFQTALQPGDARSSRGACCRPTATRGQCTCIWHMAHMHSL